MKIPPRNQLIEFEAHELHRLPAESLEGREFIGGNKRYIDFCTTNYLGFDFRSELAHKGMEFHNKWGSLTGWSRLEADPVIYPELERRVADFLGAKDVILSHTITITNFSVMSALAKKGLIVVDHKVHTVVWEACRLAKDHGAKLFKFDHQDMGSLEKVLQDHKDVSPKIVAVDGVYSISTEYAPIPELQRLCEKYDAWLYVDDAHGFGVLGRQDSKERTPYGNGGQGIVGFFGGDMRRTFYVSSFGKAFCTHTAFIAIPHDYQEPLREQCMQYIYSAPMSPFVIGMVEAAMDLNEREGDRCRHRIAQLTKRFTSGLSGLGLNFSNNGLFPVVFWEIGALDDLISIAQFLVDRGVVAGLRAYPVVPPDQCGLRFGITALHTESHIDRALSAIEIAGCRYLKKRSA